MILKIIENTICSVILITKKHKRRISSKLTISYRAPTAISVTREQKDHFSKINFGTNVL